jgi:hypothetical protein
LGGGGGRREREGGWMMVDNKAKSSKPSQTSVSRCVERERESVIYIYKYILTMKCGGRDKMW